LGCTVPPKRIRRTNRQGGHGMKVPSQAHRIIIRVHTRVCFDALNGYRFRLCPIQRSRNRSWSVGSSANALSTPRRSKRISIFAASGDMVGTAGMKLPVDQQDHRFITRATAFHQAAPLEILPHGAAKFWQAYQRFFKHLGGTNSVRLSKSPKRRSIRNINTVCDG